ncbi:hypothetical protein Tco_0084685 [Tanacetum coccineum]
MVTELSDAFLYAQSNINGLPTCDYGKIRECTCDVLEKFMLRDSNSKLIQFLMKLNDEYESVMSQILAMDPLPTVNKAYYIGINNGRKENRGSTNDGKRFCTRFNQEGHTVDQCFEKIGHPDSYKGKKGKKQGRMAANVTTGFDDHFGSDTPFDLGSENEIGMHQGGGFDQKLVVVVCQEVVKMFRGKGGESSASRDYASTSHASIFSYCTISFALFSHPHMNIKED